MCESAAQRPPWLIRRIPAGGTFQQVETLVSDLHLHTVCQSAHCPNIGECFGSKTATFLILGSLCTRNCAFCAVPKGTPSPPDKEEPNRLAQAVRQLGLEYAVITSVTRDDLSDGGAGQFVQCIEAIRQTDASIQVEVLTPDFQGSMTSLEQVLTAQPAVFNHNVETIPRLYAQVRPQGSYRRSLAVLATAAHEGTSQVKSGLMVGLGETKAEVCQVFGDLAACGVTMVTVGQYLRPSPRHLPLVEYISPDMFRVYEEMAKEAGIAKVVAGPFVRSSYQAAKLAR